MVKALHNIEDYERKETQSAFLSKSKQYLYEANRRL